MVDSRINANPSDIYSQWLYDISGYMFILFIIIIVIIIILKAIRKVNE